MVDKSQLGLAEAQLLGFTHCREGYDLVSLISSMALTLEEWEELQKIYDLNYLSEKDRKIIQKEVENENNNY